MNLFRSGSRPMAGVASHAEFRLNAPSVGLSVEVRLTERGERWVGVALSEGTARSGFGRTARQALAACLCSLGPEVSAALMADPELFSASRLLLAGPKWVKGGDG